MNSGEWSDDPSENQGMRLGATICSIVKNCKVVPELHLPMLEKSAIDYVEIWPPTERREIDVILRFFQKSRLRLWSLHAPFLNEELRRQALAKIRRTIEIGGLLGARVIVLHPSYCSPTSEPIPDHERPKRIAQAKANLEELVPVARRSNVILALENLPRTCLGNSASELKLLLEDLPEDCVGICLDTNHVKKASSLPEIIRELGSRIVTLHISDFDGVDEKHWLPGKGVINWPAVWWALEDIGYSGPWLYEITAVYDDPKANIRLIEENFQYLRSLAKRA